MESKTEAAGIEFKLFQEMRQQLYRYAIGILGSPHDAEDALQEASLKVWRHTGQLPDQSSVSAWLYRVVVNTCRDHLRKKKRRPEPRPLEVHTAQTRDRYWVEFEAMIAHLPERQQEIVILRFGLDLTFKEVADVMMLPESTVKYQLGKAIDTLRQEYKQGEEAAGNEM
ncbi:MAG: RNA polymerase sigma factor [Bacillota bacterium]|nr:RNA polymerase sigma factor [Bacillota bacterium]MDW7684599.1 RNA polymerase sigma factor [Bacillota bacterium]